MKLRNQQARYGGGIPDRGRRNGANPPAPRVRREREDVAPPGWTMERTANGNIIYSAPTMMRPHGVDAPWMTAEELDGWLPFTATVQAYTPGSNPLLGGTPITLEEFGAAATRTREFVDALHSGYDEAIQAAHRALNEMYGDGYATGMRAIRERYFDEPPAPPPVQLSRLELMFGDEEK